MNVSFRLILTSIILLTATNVNAADKYTIDSSHTSVLWKIEHVGFSSMNGKFTQITGTIALDEKNPDKSSVEVLIPIDGIVTGDPKLDEHLKGPDFFDAKGFPEARFKSTSIKLHDKNQATIHGNLTLHGVTKPITLETKLNKIGSNPMTQNPTVGFSAKTSIKRSEYNITHALPFVGDKVILEINTEAIKDQDTETPHE